MDGLRKLSWRLHDLARVTLTVLTLSLMAGCEPADEEEPEVRVPDFTPVMNPSMVFMGLNDHVIVNLSITGEPGERNFDLGAMRNTLSPTLPLGVDINLDERRVDRTDTSKITVDTGPDVPPGIYRFPVEFEQDAEGEAFVKVRNLTIIVVPTDAAPTAGAVIDLSAGDTHTLAIVEDGSVWAWGRNDHGQLGDGTVTDRQVPVPILGLPGAAQMVAAGGSHSLALMEDGSVWAWGDNERYQVQPPLSGQGGFANYLFPRQLTTFDAEPVLGNVAIAAGEEHSMRLTATGEVHVWGSNGRRQLGGTDNPDSTFDEAELPVAATAIAAGGHHSLALSGDGTAWGWGLSDRGQIGAATRRPEQGRPVDIGFVSGVVGLGAGRNHTLLLLDDGNVGGLGSNASGQLGDGTRDTPVAQPTVPPRLPNVTEVDGGWIHTLALQADRTVYAWGDNAFGQVSDSAAPAPDSLGRVLQRVPERVTGIGPSDGIAAGGRHSLSIDNRCRNLHAWGDNSVSQLGDGGGIGPGHFRATPAPVYGLGESGLEDGCEVIFALAVRGEGRVSAVAGGNTIIADEQCHTPCVSGLVVGTPVTLSAAAEDGSTFMGWSGNCSGSEAQIQTTMDRSRSCLARFGANPVASFTMEPNPYRVSVDNNVDFDAGASSDDGRIVLYEWDYENDGTFDATGVSPFTRFRDPGNYEVRLRVTDDDGLIGESVQTLVAGLVPLARFTYAPEQPRVGQIVQFDGSDSRANTGTLVRYTWDFEDDGVVDAEGVAASHQFDIPGEHRVRLRVLDSNGFSTSANEVVVVSVAPGGDLPVASFTLTPSPANVGETVRLDASNTSSTNPVASYQWDFQDDGSFDASGMTAEVIFESPGTRDIRLRVTDDQGQVAERVESLTVVAAAAGNVTLTVQHLGGGAGNVGSIPPGATCFFSPQGNDPDPCTRSLVAGESIRLLPFAGDGFVFSHWGVGDCDAEILVDAIVACDVTVTADRTVRLYFE